MRSRRTRQTWEITIACLKTINAAGKASRMQVYEIFKNETNLERWLKRLIDRWGILREIVEGGHKYYAKTDLGETVKAILIYHRDAIGPLKEILSENRLRPMFLPQKGKVSRGLTSHSARNLPATAVSG